MKRVSLVCLIVSSLCCQSNGFGQKVLSINHGHKLLEKTAGESRAPVGATVVDESFETLDGKTTSIARTCENGGAAFVFLSVACPLAKRYTQRLNRFHEEYASQGIKLIGVFSNAEDTADSVAEHIETTKFPFPVVKDRYGQLARRLSGEMTPQVILLDDTLQVQYRGAIDDNRIENLVKNHYLTDAVDALLHDETIPVSTTTTIGCTIHLSSVAKMGEVTYSGHIASILQKNCQQCHRPNQVGPFSLLSYDDAVTWATEINEYTRARLMPPWKAAPGYGQFKDDRSLSDEEIAQIDRWVKEGTPEGDPAATPAVPDFDDEWMMGKPDIVVAMPGEYTVGAEGEDDYRHFVVPTNFDEDLYIQGVDVQPGNRQTVHHVIVYVDTSGKARELDAEDPGLGYTRFGGTGFRPVAMLGGWAPGQMPQMSPEGTGAFLPKGADIVLQVHYYRTGVEEVDQTRCGLYFSKHPTPIKIDTEAAINREFEIEPGNSRYEVSAKWQADEDLYVFSVYPHMHLLGKEMKVFATLPDGTVVPMIWIKDWDFNWQGGYQFAELQFFPKGTIVEAIAYYDNSIGNPNNPHADPKPIRWGEKTTDEMCIAFMSVFPKAAYDALKSDALKGDALKGDTIKGDTIKGDAARLDTSPDDDVASIDANEGE